VKRSGQQLLVVWPSCPPSTPVSGIVQAVASVREYMKTIRSDAFSSLFSTAEKAQQDTDLDSIALPRQ